MKLKFLHKRKEEKQTEEEAFSLPKFIIERSRAIEIVFLVLGADISAHGAVCRDQL